MEIIVESKADFNHPVVSAASICAKVTRDRDLAEWNFPEKKEIDKEFGCGYPSDPKAKEWLRRNFDSAFGFPTLVRFSWKTCTVILEEHKMNINWFDEVVDPKVGTRIQPKIQKTLQFGKKNSQDGTVEV